MKRRLVAALMVVLTVAALAALAQKPFQVGKIEIIGLQHVPRDKVMAAIGFKVGDTIDAQRVKEAAAALEDLGYFSQVKPELYTEDDRVVVRFTVVEYPVIRKIVLEGLPKEPSMKDGLIPFLIRWFSQGIYVSEHDIRRTLEDHGIKAGEVLNAKALQEALKAILEDIRDKDDIATVQISRVEPGPELVIEFEFLPVLGNRFEGLTTVPEEVAASLVDVPVGKVGRLSQIRASYQRLLDSVYFSSVELSPEADKERKGVWLVWKLKERVLLPQPTALKGIRLVGVKALPPAEVEARLGELPAGTVDNYQVLRALEGVFSYYVREGYIMVDLVPAGIEDGILTVEVREGVISRIEITGNTRTKEFVIRRVMGLREGEYLTRARLFAAQQALRALGYFSEVNLNPVREDGGVVLKVSVREIAKLGNIRGAFSLSQDGGLVGNLDYTQRNLFGTANDLSLSLKHGLTGGSGTTWSAKWTSHAMPVFDLVSVELYHRIQSPSRTLGGKISLTYPVAYLWDLDLGLTSEARWRGPEGLPPRNVIDLGLTYDSRDDPFFFPRRGALGKLSVAKAGDFAPGVRYTEVSLELAAFHPVDFGVGEGATRGALAQRVLIKWGMDLPEEYWFELGGVNSVRGAASPVKTDRLLLLNTEFRVEVAQGAHVALFWDLGASLADDVVKTSVGIELAARFMGSFVRLDLAWPNDRPWNWVPQFEFGWAPLF